MKLIQQLPQFYDNPVTTEIQEGIESELDIYTSRKQATISQLYIDSATWGLAFWDKFCGIDTRHLNIVERRNWIKSRLRSRGTTTKDAIRDVVKAFCSEVTVTEINPEYKFILELTETSESDFSKVWDLLDIHQAIFEVKPAHLEHEIHLTNSRSMEITTEMGNTHYTYIPCNCVYAGGLQANTYNTEDELVQLAPSTNI